MLASFFILTLVVLEFFAIWFAWRAVSSARTSQGAVGWVVFLITAPYLGVPLYLFLGHHKFRGYLISRRDSEEIVEGVQAFRRQNAPVTSPNFPVEAFEQISDLPAVRGNCMTPLIDGQETFDAIFAAIDGAQHYVLVQFYIIHDDILGRALKATLTKASKRGVSVRLMFDSVGCIKLPRTYYNELVANGVQVVDPKEARGPKNRFQINFRNHRKTVIVDGQIAFTGGLNVGDEYMGRSDKFGPWRDTHAALAGPVVSQLQLVFAEDWHWATGESLIDPLNWEATHSTVDATGMIVATGPGDSMETGALFFFSAISAAQYRVWIASPYFVPDTDVLTALKHAALRGVDVRILVPDVIDHKIPWLAAFAFFDEIRDAGVQVWRYKKGFMHQKVVLVDDNLAAIGTTNLDNRSFRLNFEAMAVMFDSDIAYKTADFLENDFKRSFQLEKSLSDQPRYIRVGAPFAKLFAPVL